MVECDRCGRDVDLPFRCNYCGGYFCSEHRLPEFHECTGLYQYRTSARRRWERSAPRYEDRSYSGGPGPSIKTLFRFSDKELEHLGISLLIISALPLMMLGNDLFRNPMVGVGAILIFAAAFLFHELAHKFMAQRLGYWAEYRLNKFGLLITLLSFISPFKLVAPGAVMISGLMYGDDYGKISLAGPITNIVQALVFLAIRLTAMNSLVWSLAHLGIIINSSLALFNLIPFGVFDGVKILRWDRRAWVAATATAAVIYVFASI
ncbi:MAG: AN1-type zinc finger domain-containing protein [Candidatus Bathyarchaeota archaeon]|jgi:Zn-dependent protease